MPLSPAPIQEPLDSKGGLATQPWVKWFLNAVTIINATAAGGVSSVFGRTGIVVAQTGDYDTSEVPDTVNARYVTDANLVVINNTSGVNTGDQFIFDGGSP